MAHLSFLFKFHYGTANGFGMYKTNFYEHNEEKTNNFKILNG